MTMGTPTDFILGACHVVMKFPVLGVAVCFGVADYNTDVLPVNFVNNTQMTQHECGIGDEYILIDTEEVGAYVSLGECLEEYDPIALAELRERCLRPEAKDEEICRHIE